MKIYLRPGKVSVLSFDLDDTLYDNRPVIRTARTRLNDHLCSRFNAAHEWSDSDWLACKRLVVRANPALLHDTGACREAVLTRALTLWGYSPDQVKREVAQAMECFLHYRSDFSVPEDTLALLAQLDEKYVLVGITNGNVDADKIGLGELMRFVLHPGQGVRMKPRGDMFEQACERLAVTPAEILHVGDSWSSDVQGARRAGCYSAWLNPGVGAEPSIPGAGSLPHLELSRLSELIQI